MTIQSGRKRLESRWKLAKRYAAVQQEDWDKLVGVVTGLESLAEDETSYFRNIKRQERARALAARQRTMSEFRDIVSSGPVRFSKTPCPCGRNHYAYHVESTTICPVHYWLCRCRELWDQWGTKAMVEWATENPLSDGLKRIDEEKDATAVEEDDGEPES